MAEDNEGKEPSEGSSGTSKIVKVFCLIFPWILVLIFQAQFILIEEKFAAIKLQLSMLNNSSMEERRSLSKRSLGGNDRDAVKKISGSSNGVEAAHLYGTFPFQKIEKNGKIGPWSFSSPGNAFVVLRAKNTELEIATKGIYFVYAQIYYFTNQSSNSYQVLTYNGTEQRENHRTLSTCAGQGRNTMGEVSCYTGFTGTFNKGQRVYLHQIEQNRIINNSNSCSFFGVVLLKKTGSRKGRREADGEDVTKM